MGRILITGATGFLGGAVARTLRDDGAEILATGRNAAAWTQDDIPFCSCDLASGRAAVADLVKGCEAVIHCAALSAPWGRGKDFLAANVTATRHLVECSRSSGVSRLVHISSPSVLFAFREMSGRIYHITSGAPVRRSLALGTMLDACGLEVRFRPVPIGLAMSLAGGLEITSRWCILGRWEPPLTRYFLGVLAYSQTLDISEARRDLGYEPRTDILAALTETGRRWRLRNPGGERGTA